MRQKELDILASPNSLMQVSQVRPQGEEKFDQKNALRKQLSASLLVLSVY